MDTGCEGGMLHGNFDNAPYFYREGRIFTGGYIWQYEGCMPIKSPPPCIRRSALLTLTRWAVMPGLTVVEFLLADEGPGDGGVALIPGYISATRPSL
jgi:hypothetical protein